ncbi:MAG: 50S ribosomal protein L5, partial [Muribaculaceae bacterium]|nr:50S ribosomal protein L5 [Muribaculaceae bacterium]
MMSTTTLKKDYQERIIPALTKEFNYTTVMQVPRLEKSVINPGLGEATQDKKIIET